MIKRLKRGLIKVVEELIQKLTKSDSVSGRIQQVKASKERRHLSLMSTPKQTYMDNLGDIQLPKLFLNKWRQ